MGPVATIGSNFKNLIESMGLLNLIGFGVEGGQGWSRVIKAGIGWKGKKE